MVTLSSLYLLALEDSYYMRTNNKLTRAFSNERLTALISEAISCNASTSEIVEFTAEVNKLYQVNN